MFPESQWNSHQVGTDQNGHRSRSERSSCRWQVSSLFLDFKSFKTSYKSNKNNSSQSVTNFIWETPFPSRYRDLIEEGRHQFQKEIAALLPHVNLSQKDGSAHLTEEELNLFMTHAFQVFRRYIFVVLFSKRQNLFVTHENT